VGYTTISMDKSTFYNTEIATDTHVKETNSIILINKDYIFSKPAS